MFSKEGLAKYTERRSGKAPGGGVPAGPSPDDSDDSSTDADDKCVCPKCGEAHTRMGSPIKNGEEADHYLPGDI